MPETPVLVQYQQGNDVSPAPEGYEQITGPLNPLRSTASRLSHFDEDVYDLSAESHLVRLVKAFLSDSGVGLLQKQMLLVRLQQSLSGTHYFDLDAFYGAIFGSGRKVDEILPHDPYGEPLSIEDWDEMQIRDGAYKARVSRLSQAIHLGATARGIRLFAEALTGVEFDLTEDWQYGPYMSHTWDDWDGENWDDLDGLSWDEMERSPAATTERIRNIATLHPMRPLSAGEIFDLEQALDRLKPANMVVLVSSATPDIDIVDVKFSPKSNSERWEVRQLIQNSRIRGILPFPGQPEDEFISPPLNPWSGYSGEAWTVLDRTPRTLAYITPSDVNTSLVIDPTGKDMAPQALAGSGSNGQPVVSLPEYALKPVQGLYSGRSASDGIVTANPYGERSGTGSYLTVDGLSADFAERALSTSLRQTELFWTTPNRPYTDPTNEILELRFDQPVNFNHVSFEFAKFPCSLDVQYWDRSDGQWISIGSVEQRESVPYSFPNQPPADAVHPFHYGTGHWEKRSFSTTAVLTQHLRFVFKRIEGNGPVGNVGGDTPRMLAYPLGLREIDVGFRANSLARVPHVSSSAPVSTSRNAAGLQTRYFLDVASASRVADDELTAWICDPQPFSDAVVNLYLSLGDGTFPEVINSLYLDPVHVGSIMNVYTTLDVPPGDALSEPKDDVVFAQVYGSVSPVSDGNRGLEFPSEDIAWIDVDTVPLGGTSTGGQLWMGLSWEFKDFPVAPARGKFVGVTEVSIPGGHISISHGLEDGTDDYTIYTTVNGNVVKTTWPDFIPSAGKTMRLLVAVGENFASTIAQIDSDDVKWGTLINQAFSRGVSTTFDPQTQRHPTDYYETKAKELPLALDASTHVGGSEWSGSLVAGVQDQYFFGNVSDVTERFIYFPGDVSNYLNVPVNVAQTDLATSERIFGHVRIHPTEWVTGSERFFGGSLGFNINAGGGFGWGLASDGRLVFEWDTSGSTTKVYSDTRIPRDTSRPVDVSFTLDNGTLRFFWKDTESVTWNLLGNALDVSGIVIGNPSRAFRIGMACPDGGTRAARPFLGAMSEFQLATGIATRGADPDAFAGTMVIDIRHQDLGVFTPGTNITSFTSSTGDTVGILIDDDGGLILPLTVLDGPGFVQPGLSGDGISVFDQVADVDFRHILAAAVTTAIPFAPATGYAPVLTKKLSPSSTDRGWGIYLKSNENFVLLASDGVSQVETEWTLAPGTGYMQPTSCLSVQMVDSEARLTFYKVGSTSEEVEIIDGGGASGGFSGPPLDGGDAFGVFDEQFDQLETSALQYVSEDISSLLGLDNSEPVRILADGTSVTPGVVYSAAAGSEERSSSVPNFNRVALSMAEMSVFSSIGSSWTVSKDGQGLSRGEVLFQQSTGVILPNGNITSEDSVLVDCKSAHVRIGSAVGRGSGIKVLGAVMGYGGGPGLDYLSSPDSYNKIPLSNDTKKNLGTFLRYHPDYFGWTEGLLQSIGFMGGTPEAWGQAKWTPVGQFVLSKGSYNFPDVIAKAVKLEFTQLTPEPYESFLPIDRSVSRMTILSDKERGYSQSPQQQAAIEILTQNRYSESPRSFLDETDPLLNNVSPTAGAVVTDGATRDSMSRQFGPLYGLAPWQQSFHSTIQPVAGIHSYDVAQVRSVTRTAFFVGLRTVRVRRVGQRAKRDNPYFWETFYDADNIDLPKTNFEIEPGQLYTPEFNSSTLMPIARTAVSKPFYTRSPILGVQFATQQSQSFQVIPDDEFRSNSNKTSTFQVPEQWHRSGDGIVFWDQSYGSVRVSRDPSVLDAYYAPDTPIVHPPVTPVLSSGFARIITVDEDSTGGIESPNVLIAPRGVVWVAARVAAYNELNADLYLRVYDTATGAILAEQSFRPKTGFPSEVTMSLISYRAEPYNVSVRVEQDGPYYDSWIMYALSAFDSSVLWEFSNDGGETWTPGYTARNIVNGVVEFPFVGSALMWRCKAYRYNAIIDAIELRPWYSRRIGAPL